SDDPRRMQRHSDSSAIPELSAHLHRALDRGPLLIPSALQQQQQLAPRQLHHRRSSAETLVAKVLQDEGLNRWVDPQCLQREIAEATNMTHEEMNVAAREIIRRSRHMDSSYHDNDNLSAASLTDVSARHRQSPAGYQQHEMQDRTHYFPSDSIDKQAVVNVTTL
ncbi:unnamed protein product, partial [Candidula unifasciata]